MSESSDKVAVAAGGAGADEAYDDELDRSLAADACASRSPAVTSTNEALASVVFPTLNVLSSNNAWSLKKEALSDDEGGGGV